MHDTSPSRRALLKATGALGTVAALAISPAAARLGADPVLALIDAHRRAWARLTLALDDLWRVEMAFGGGSREAEEIEPRVDDLRADEACARVALLKTVPATNVGMTAVLDYLRQADLYQDLTEHDDEIALLLTTIRAFVTREVRHG
ncbi:hypothetical protein [Xanthobacter sp. 126]|uniref:hypothetical protein n=1 Tax=Xanthobacter sp. 126 TaxID=1131814 RepID=UPI00045E9CD4|nr:hypothetical protein [Xanthobacter sp. 126]